MPNLGYIKLQGLIVTDSGVCVWVLFYACVCVQVANTSVHLAQSDVSSSLRTGTVWGPALLSTVVWPGGAREGETVVAWQSLCLSSVSYCETCL